MSQGKNRKTAAPGRLIGYARVSTEEQGTATQPENRLGTICRRIPVSTHPESGLCIVHHEA